ncbi:MAG: hypothetical protein ACK47B_01430 [Armatimonadota bacterium]
MPALPPWLWIVIGVVLLLALAARSHYNRFRAMCRTVREELPKLLKERHPEVEVLGEEQGNLLLRMPDGRQRVWEMEDLYVAVGRLPGLGRDPAARAALCQQAIALLMDPASAPISAAEATQGLRPQLMRPEALREFPREADPFHRPLPDLGLSVVYMHGIPEGWCVLARQDLTDLGLTPEELHQTALENLRKGFPREMVAAALAGEVSAVQLQDGFDGARLLVVPGLLKPGQELVALAPHTHALVLLPPDAAGSPETLRDAMRMLECGSHARLLDRPVRVTSDGFKPLRT